MLQNADLRTGSVNRGESGVNHQNVSFLEMPALERQRDREGSAYLEFLRVASMSVGIYVLPAGSEDSQSPHKQDELYYVVKGRGRMRADSHDRPVGQGSLIFIAADIEHRFHHIEEELTVLVFFAPAETS